MPTHNNIMKYHIHQALIVAVVFFIFHPIVGKSQIILLNPPDVNLAVLDISANGDIIVGIATGSSIQLSAFRWLSGEGVTFLSDFYATGVSADGKTIVGSGALKGGYGAFRWDLDEGLVPLDDAVLDKELLFSVDAISADGRVIAGRMGLKSPNKRVPVRWTKEEGVVLLGNLFFETAEWHQIDMAGISSDGNIIVGNVRTGGSGGAFRWTPSEGMLDLNNSPGWIADTWVQGISSDGTTIIGLTTNANNAFEGVVWTEKGGAIRIGDLSGDLEYSEVLDVSADGRIVVGGSFSHRGYEGIRWTQKRGLQTVIEWLRESGHTVGDDIFLGAADAISGDGSVIVGGLYYTEGVENSGGSGWLARGDSGVITLDEFTASFGTTASIPQVTNALPSTILNGSHHRILLLQSQLDKENSFWVNGDFAHHGRRDADLSIGEAGIAHDFAPGLRGGIGLGWGYLDQDLTFGGNHELDGQYLVAELDWNIEGTPIILSATGVYGDWNADIKRGYLNGGIPDQSKGTTDVDTLSLRLRVDWLDLFKLKQFRFTPHLSYTLTRIESDAYVESGGGFPVAFNGQSHTTEEIRLGLTGEADISDKTKLRGIFEGVYRIDDSNAGFSGQVIGLFGFSIPGAKNNQEWVRIGAEIEHQIDDNKIITATVFGATRGEDPEVSTAVNFRINF